MGVHRDRQPPHHFSEHAVEHVLGEYDVPFCPQLPRLEGDMVGEWLGFDPLRCGWTPDRDRERPADGTPCSPRSRAAHAACRLSAALARLGASLAAVGPSSLLTASCGTGRLSPRREAEVGGARLRRRVGARTVATDPEPA